MENVLLTTDNYCDKIKAHQEGLEHYALSVLIFNKKGELLLQKRAKKKYHSGGLWTNTCCTHPTSLNIKQIQEMAEARLNYEMGLNCNLEYTFSFSYWAKCNSLIENEYDFVFVGFTDADPVINPNEVCEYKWTDLEYIYSDKSKNPEIYTPWFHILMEQWNNHKMKNVSSR